MNIFLIILNTGTFINLLQPIMSHLEDTETPTLKLKQKFRLLTCSGHTQSPERFQVSIKDKLLLTFQQQLPPWLPPLPPTFKL